MRWQQQRRWIWRAALAGSCGSLAHFLLIYLKGAFGILPSFQPYQALQLALSHWLDGNVNPWVPWALSFVNGFTIVGFTFARIYSRLPGRSGAIKGAQFGVAMWIAMGSVFFPLIGLGAFATGIGLGVWPSIFSLAMLLSYSVVMGFVYQLLRR